MSQIDYRLNKQLTQEIILSLGGNKTVAGLFKLTPSAVSTWKVKGMPYACFLYLREKFTDNAILQRPEVQAL